MKLKALLFGKTYAFRDVKDVLAKANEEKSGDKLAGVAARSAEERVAAKVVLSELLLSDLREHPAVPYEDDEVTRIIQDDVNERDTLEEKFSLADRFDLRLTFAAPTQEEYFTIVRALLENYGFKVVDLGRDVAPEAVVEAAVRLDCRLVGLSALMTTTVGFMEETIRLLKAAKPDCRTVVGGAVLTAEYAAQIGATYYGKDAMATVRVAEEVFG